MSGLRDMVLLTRSLIYSALASTGDLPGRRFEYYGRRLGWRQKCHGKPARQLLVNPVSSVRYFEFDFVERHLPDNPYLKILDVASPVLFGYYICETRSCEYLYVNLDKRELELIEEQIDRVQVKGNYDMEVQDARRLPWADGSFDVVLSISVIEHIPEQGDSAAIREMWRVLRPGGLLLITLPVAAHYEEEFRPQDTYRIGLQEEGDGYFFQRLYDEVAMNERLIMPLGSGCSTQLEVFGEQSAGFFPSYERKWLKYGLQQTVRDPYLMSRNMVRFDRVSYLPGTGVAGVCVRKN